MKSRRKIEHSNLDGGSVGGKKYLSADGMMMKRFFEKKTGFDWRLNAFETRNRAVGGHQQLQVVEKTA